LRGIGFWNTKLCDSNLQGIDLEGADLNSADLTNASLIGANLFMANLYAADLTRTNLSHTYMDHVDLRFAILDSTILREAELQASIWEDVEINNAELHKAKMGRTILGNCDLSKTLGIDTVLHEGPSIIGIDTIYRSKGQIPEIFLRGAGLPDNFITYMASLTGKAFEFYSCFISYSRKDRAFAERIYADLQSQGVRSWYAPQDLRIGERIRPGIDESIHKHDKLLLILSRNSIESQWVEKEVEVAMDQELIQKRTVLFPIRLDNTVMKIQSGWPADIRRTRHIGDFRRWKEHDSYQKSFERLMRDLKANKNESNRA